ncbi:MAG: energy transducer TonB [Bacteroidota bacterium]
MIKTTILIAILLGPLLLFSQKRAEQITTPKEEPNDEVFTLVDEMASFPGGKKALQRFLTTNLDYPKYASEMGIEGRVFVQFIVEKDGSITNISVIRGIGGGCDLEAVRVISAMPTWIPAKFEGEPVRQKAVQLLSFKFNDINKSRIKKSHFN